MNDRCAAELNQTNQTVLRTLPDNRMKNVKINTHRHNGFSLVEMLVVIAIIGLIAAITIPNIGALNKDKTKTAGQAPALNSEQQTNTGSALPAGVQSLDNIARDLVIIHSGYVKSGKMTADKNGTLAATLEAINQKTEPNVNTPAITALRETPTMKQLLESHLAIDPNTGLLVVKKQNGTASTILGAGGNDKNNS